MKILAINIGNSRTAAGWFSRGKIRRAVRTDDITPVMLEAVADGETPDGICLCSVVPGRNRAWGRLVKKMFPRVSVLWVNSKLDFGIPVDLKRPDQTGCDRYANAVAGAELCGMPCIVCDFGTATTYNLVLPRRGFTGGVIAPGYGMWFDAMGSGVTQLPRLKPGGIRRQTGRNTEEAMRLSARWGYRGMVTEILWQLARACGRKDPFVCATGGFARKVMRDAGLKIPVLPDLTLHGIARIYELNA